MNNKAFVWDFINENGGIRKALRVGFIKIIGDKIMSEMLIDNMEFVQACKAASVKALTGKVNDDDINNFLNYLTVDNVEGDNIVGIPRPKEAKSELYTVGVYGYVKCTPTHLPYHFEANHWGLGLAVMACYGTMYTAYANWEDLFNETRGYHAQGIADAGGILQITWFNGDHKPIGQFNSVAGGIGIFEVGGKGRWKKK